MRQSDIKLIKLHSEAGRAVRTYGTEGSEWDSMKPLQPIESSVSLHMPNQSVRQATFRPLVALVALPAFEHTSVKNNRRENQKKGDKY